MKETGGANMARMNRRLAAVAAIAVFTVGAASCSSDEGADVDAGGDSVSSTVAEEDGTSSTGETGGDSTDEGSGGSADSGSGGSSGADGSVPDQGADGEDPPSTGSLEEYSSEEICAQLEIVKAFDEQGEAIPVDDFEAQQTMLLANLPSAEQALRTAAGISPAELSKAFTVVADAYGKILPGVEAATNLDELMAAYTVVDGATMDAAGSTIDEFSEDACGFRLGG